MTTSERANTAAGASPALKKTRWIGRASAAPPRHPDHDAVAHESGVERHRHVVGRDELAKMRYHLRIADRQRLRHRTDGEAFLEIGKIGQLRHKRAVDEDDAATLDRCQRRAGVPRARFGGGAGNTGERLGVAHQRAQVGVLPFLYPPVRQAGRIKTLERCSRNAATAAAPKLGLGSSPPARLGDRSISALRKTSCHRRELAGSSVTCG